MGKFDGYLICSDLDGTFRNKDDINPNCNAVKYFTDNGGSFTFTTGRTISHLETLEYNYLINAPVCVCNGGGIYDYEKQELLFEGRINFTFGEFLKGVKDYKGSQPIIYIYNSCFSDGFAFDETEKITEELLSLNAVKYVCVFENVQEADNFKEYAKNNKLFEKCYIGKSWEVGVEFNSSDSTKGNAVKFIKKYLGNIHTSVGIGDYENDIPLLRDADIGVAVGDALDCVKAVADVVVKPHRESSLEDLIRYLEMKIDSKG